MFVNPHYSSRVYNLYHILNMFSRFTRLSVRRCVHTASTTSRPWSKTVKLVFGASAATATYMTWQLTNERNYLALDSINSTSERNS